jgi:shikimate kinase
MAPFELRGDEIDPKMRRVSSPRRRSRPFGPVLEVTVTRPGGEGGEKQTREEESGGLEALAEGLRIDRTIALIGLMGAGKTTIGRRVAAALRLPFRDADCEIEKAAGLSVQEIFDRHGEAEFRRGERGVIRRLLNEPPHVLATGGGAFMDPETRACLRARAVTVWLRADLDVLTRRVERRDDRPLLKEADPRAVMEQLMAQRYPIYAQADIVVDSNNAPHANAAALVLKALRARLQAPA